MRRVLDDDPPDCLDCGACCFAELPHYVPVRGDDYERLGEQAEQLTAWHGTRCFMRMEHGRCASLVVGGAVGDYACAVYEQRPETCRTLERGSPECAGERHAKLARARRALRVL